MYKGTVYVPSNVSRARHPADHLSIMAETIGSRYNFKVICADRLNISDVEGSYLFTIKAPQIGYYQCIDGISKLPSNINFICYLQDTDGYCDPGHSNHSGYKRVLNDTLNRANTILYSYKDSYMSAFSQYMHKSVFFPAFVIPTTRYSKFPINLSSRVKKCLLTGSCEPGWYPIRHHAYTHRNNIIDVIEHPGYGVPINDMINHPKVFIRDRYGELMAKYTCCLTTTFRGKHRGEEDWIVCKYYEITAAGCVLLANHCPEMDELGFVDMQNYVKVTIDDYASKIRDIITNPAKYEGIADAGRKLTLTKHTFENRLLEIDKLIT